MRVLIAGAGAIGRRLLTELSEAGGSELAVVDIDGQPCEELADEFDALVIHGDATDPDILDKAQINQTDALVAVTGSDAINTVIAMLGHRFGIDKVIVKITTNSLRGALEEIGVTDIVAPTIAAAASINASLHEARREDLSLLSQGGLTLTELDVGAQSDGRRLGDVEVPEGLLLVGVLHGEEASLARADTRLAEGDVILAVAEHGHTAETARQSLEDHV